MHLGGVKHVASDKQQTRTFPLTSNQSLQRFDSSPSSAQRNAQSPVFLWHEGHTDPRARTHMLNPRNLVRGTWPGGHIEIQDPSVAGCKAPKPVSLHKNRAGPINPTVPSLSLAQPQPLPALIYQKVFAVTSHDLPARFTFAPGQIVSK